MAKLYNDKLFFKERGAVVHEWYYAPQGKTDPVNVGWVLVGHFRDEAEVDAFIDWAERAIYPKVQLRRVHIINSYANWRKYVRKI